MKAINWKSLSFSLIISAIVNATALSIFLFQYLSTLSYLFQEILSHINNSNASGKTAYVIAEGRPTPLWLWALLFSASYILVTGISYLLIELRNRRKK
jgi:hypothetical protein